VNWDAVYGPITYNARPLRCLPKALICYKPTRQSLALLKENS
jgi:hypothetical protein